MNKNPTEIELLEEAKWLFSHISNTDCPYVGECYSLQLRIEKFLDAKQEVSYIDSTTL